MTPQIIDKLVRFHTGEHDTQLVIEHSQEIPEFFLDDLSEARKASTHGRMGEMHRFASLPVALYEMWMAQGYDAKREPAHRTVARLKADGLDAFLTTERKV
jgi:hypothetical protein